MSLYEQQKESCLRKLPSIRKAEKEETERVEDSCMTAVKSHDEVRGTAKNFAS